MIPRYSLGNNSGVIPSRQSFLAVVFQEGKEFSYKTCLKDRRLAPGHFYLLNKRSFTFFLGSVYCLSNVLEKTFY